MQKAISDPQRRRPPNRAGAFAFRQSRLTALALIVLLPYALFTLLRLAGRDLPAVQKALGEPATAIALLALVLIGVFHMWLGMREILEDYARGNTLRNWLVANSVFCIVTAAAAGGALLKLWLWS